MRRRYAPRRAARRQASRSTSRSPRADRRWLRTGPAAPAPAPPGSWYFLWSPGAVEPLGDGDLERAGEKGQELGAKTRLEGVGGAGADAHQPDRRRTAEGQSQQRLRADETGGAAEQRRVALDVCAQQRVAVGAEQSVDGAGW